MQSTELAQFLNNNFMAQFPKDVATYLEGLNPNDASKLLAEQPISVIQSIWFYLNPLNKTSVFLALSEDKATQLLSLMDVAPSAALLIHLPEDIQTHYLEKLKPDYAQLIKQYMTYPHNVAGHIMDEIAHTYDSSGTVGEVLQLIKKSKLSPSLNIYLIDKNLKLCGRVNLQKLLIADEDQVISSLSTKSPIYLQALAPLDEITEIFEKSKLDALPVVDAHQHLIGIIYATKFIENLKEDITTDIQTMVGASAEEKALSSSIFSVRKRLPWLFINLLTAFLAAFVVGLFEPTIAKFTALAVLLPVVAGQSGNAGAQALAVTMRGLALREVTIRQWLQVILKESSTGLISGFAVAVVCAIAVYYWSQSYGLAIILASSMIISVAIACISGALIPMLLKKFGQDPAQSSSIFLTTVTDVTGFMSFLGIATILAQFL